MSENESLRRKFKVRLALSRLFCCTCFVLSCRFSRRWLVVGKEEGQTISNTIVSLEYLLIMMRLQILLALGLPFLSLGFSLHSSFLAQTTSPTSRLGVVASRTKSTVPSNNNNGLSMHMGHSHSHHHHSHVHENSNSATALMRPTSVRRKISLVVFAACVVLAPRLIIKKSITRAHSATFVLTCIALTMIDQIRGGFATIVEKLRVSFRGTNMPDADDCWGSGVNHCSHVLSVLSDVSALSHSLSHAYATNKALGLFVS